MSQIYHARKIQLIANGINSSAGSNVFRVNEFNVIFELKTSPYCIVIADNNDDPVLVVALDECFLPKKIVDHTTRTLAEQHAFFDSILSEIVKLVHKDILQTQPIVPSNKNSLKEGMFTVGLALIVKRLIAAETKEMIFGESMVSFDFLSVPKKVEVYRNNDLIITVTLDENNIPTVIEDYRKDQWPATQILLDLSLIHI